MNAKSVYFPSLNALRFIGAFMVIIHHVEQFKVLFKIDAYSLWFNPAVHIFGALGVFLFFVLSGFLITTLLLNEEQASNTISISRFYIRRILRIWPLYFLIVLSALFVLPYISVFNIPGIIIADEHTNFAWKLILYVFFLPNLALTLFGPIPFAAPAWSIGAEEQFYLIWPVGMKYAKSKLLFMAMVLVVYMTMLYVFGYVKNDSVIEKYIFHFLGGLPIDCMAIGGIYAFICHSTKKMFVSVKQLLFSRYIQYPVFIAAAFFTVRGYSFGFFQNEVYGLLYGLIICNLALNKNCIISLEYGWLSYLGKISYGLYFYHCIIIVVVINLLQKFGFSVVIWVYPLVLIFTIIVASLSYRFFERPFIAKKYSYT